MAGLSAAASNEGVDMATKGKAVKAADNGMEPTVEAPKAASLRELVEEAAALAEDLAASGGLDDTAQARLVEVTGQALELVRAGKASRGSTMTPEEKRAKQQEYNSRPEVKDPRKAYNARRNARLRELMELEKMLKAAEVPEETPDDE